MALARGVGAPSGTRTPNPLKSAAQISAMLPILLNAAVTRENAWIARSGAGTDLARFWRERRGVKRGVSSLLAPGDQGPCLHKTPAEMPAFA